MKRGYATIATGDEKYYKMAVALLHSYKLKCKINLPFAIICDKANQYTEEFDDVIIMDCSNRSYMDKLTLYQYVPYDATIFIDADSLILRNPEELWKDFSDQSCVSCYGAVLPIGDKKSWFSYENAGIYKDKIKYLIDLHGGIYFIKRGEECRRIFETAIELAKHYSEYKFRSFSLPADEPVVAMAMAIHHVKPCEKKANIIFMPSYRNRIKITVNGYIYIDKKRRSESVLHFSAPNTRGFLYRYLTALYDCRYQKKPINNKYLYFQTLLKTLPEELWMDIKHQGGILLRKIFSDR